jgi:hypothetical protein
MVLYVAVVAILNLVLGYGLAVYLGSGRMPSRAVNLADAEPDSDYDSSDQYSTYESGYESELETAASA